MISIIITAYKEARTIGRAVESILKNKFKEKYEIIITAPDNETLDIAKKYSKKNKKIKILKDNGEGKPAALNLVFKKAKGDILILTDGDVYINENAISLLLEKFKDKNVGAASGRPISLDSKETMLGFWSHLLSDTAHHLRLNRVCQNKVIVCSGYLYAFRKELIKSVPKEALSEDAVISHMVYDQGYKIDYSPKSEVFVSYPKNFSDWIKQKKRSAGGYNQLNLMTKNKERMRSFSKESAGIFLVLSYPKTIKYLFYTLCLIFARIYLWLLIFIDINLKKKNLKKIWVRIESTK
jgi:cellulose synthase/poly-beta-1,6-N-acetylglucosamine synthase-like glycosyltransferase